MNKLIVVVLDDGQEWRFDADKYEWENNPHSDNLVDIYKDNNLIATFRVACIKGVYELFEGVKDE